MEKDMAGTTPDMDEGNIHDIVGSYYLFYQSLSELRCVVDDAEDISSETHANLCGLLDQLEGQLMYTCTYLYGV